LSHELQPSQTSAPKTPRLQLGVRGKLLTGFGFAAALIVLIGIDGQRRVVEEHRQFEELHQQHLLPMASLSDLRGAVSRVRVQLSTLALAEEAKTTAALLELREADSRLLEMIGQSQTLAAAGHESLRAAVEGAELFRRPYQDALARGDANALAGLAQSAEAMQPYESAIGTLTRIKTFHTKEADRLATVQLTDVARVRVMMTGILIASLAFVLGVGLFIARVFTRQLSRTIFVLDRLANGDFTHRVRVHSRDEIGGMGLALNGALDRISTAMTELGQKAERLLGSSQKLAAVSTKLSAGAEETSAQASAVAASAEQVSRNVQTVASGASQMNASIREIANNSGEAARVATAAVGKAQATNATVSKLGESSGEIGNVVKVITSIAEQTNLLALNATIEAARAGEAGRGFAVVANEVKELAKETARAMEDIGRKIAAIQADTRGAVTAIGEITAIVEQVNELQTTIASAVEEQAATTNEIGRNVDEAARATGSIATNIGGVAQAAGGTKQGAGDASGAASEMAGLAQELKQVLARFRFEAHQLQAEAADQRAAGLPQLRPAAWGA